MLNNLQEFMSGDPAHALVRLWSDQLGEAEAAAIHNRMKRDPQYGDELQDILGGLSLRSRASPAMARSKRSPGDTRGCCEDAPAGNGALALGMAAGMLVAVGAIPAVFSLGSGDRTLPMYSTASESSKRSSWTMGARSRSIPAGQLVVDHSEAGTRGPAGARRGIFEGGDDPKRPFTVALGLRSVTALGTAFNIRKDPQRYQVAVIEGEVALA